MASKMTMVNVQQGPICIIGMHRSGTSMVARLLNLCGLYLGPAEHLVGSLESNPLGHFEHVGFLKINEALLAHLGGSSDNPPDLKDGWELDPSLEPFVHEAQALIGTFPSHVLWGWKEPRTSLLVPFWRLLIPSIRFVICVRNPLDVAKSLARRDGVSIEHGAALWYRYMRAAIRDTEGCPRILTFYEDFFRDPDQETRKLLSFCGLGFPANSSELEDAVASDLRHHSSGLSELLGDQRILPQHVLFFLGLRAIETLSYSGARLGCLDTDVSLEGASELIRLTETATVGGTELERRWAAIIEDKDALIADLNSQLVAMQQTMGWRMLERLRRMRDQVFPEGSRRRNIYWGLRRGSEVLLEEGPATFAWKLGHKTLKLASALVPKPRAVRRLRATLSPSIRRRMAELEASGLFDAEWYLAQNPDVRAAGMDPLVHYVRHGAAQGRSPNPLFDASLYVAAHHGKVHPEDALLHFYHSGLDVAPGAYRTPDVLVSVQRRYQASTEMRCLRDGRPTQRKFAVYLQCGSGSVHRQWLKGEVRPWDLVVNHYDDTHVGRIPCDIEFQQVGAHPGTKFTSFLTLLTLWPDLVRQYDYIMLLDDDILMSERDVTLLFETATKYSLDLAQASLTVDSYYAHPVCKHRAAAHPRYVNAVEIMMPILSRRAVEVGGHVFAQTVSGWGLDLVLGKLVAEQLNGRAAIIDSIAARHTKPIDPRKGAFYMMLRESNIFPEIELTHMQRMYGTGRDIVELGRP